MRYIILILGSILFFWFGGGLYYIYYTESYKVTNRSQTDAIVVYTGGSQRINTGVSLLKAGYAPLLFISGVASPGQLKNFLNENGVQQDQVIYGLSANTTKDNAAEIAEFMTTHSLTSIRLVTSSYHMPRALLETQKLVPRGTIIIPNPVFPVQRNYMVLFKEYNKYLIILTLQYFH